MHFPFMLYVNGQGHWAVIKAIRHVKCYVRKPNLKRTVDGQDGLSRSAELLGCMSELVVDEESSAVYRKHYKNHHAQDHLDAPGKSRKHPEDKFDGK